MDVVDCGSGGFNMDEYGLGLFVLDEGMGCLSGGFQNWDDAMHRFHPHL